MAELSDQQQQKRQYQQSSPSTVRSSTDWNTSSVLPLLQTKNNHIYYSDISDNNNAGLFNDLDTQNNDIPSINLLNEAQSFDISHLSCFQFFNEGRSLIAALSNAELQLFDINDEQEDAEGDNNNDHSKNIQLVLKKRINLNMISLKNITRIEILTDLNILIIENSNNYNNNTTGDTVLYLFKFSNFKFLEVLKSSKDFSHFKIYDFQYQRNLYLKYNNTIIKDDEYQVDYRFSTIPRFSYLAFSKNKELTILQFPSNNIPTKSKNYYMKTIKFNSKIKDFQFLNNKKKKKRKFSGINENIRDINNVSMLVVLNDLKFYLLKNLININEEDQILINHHNHFQVILLEINLFTKNFFYNFNFKMLDIYNFENLTMLVKDNSSLLLNNYIQDDKGDSKLILDKHDNDKIKRKIDKLDNENEELKISNFIKNWKYPIGDILYLYPYILIILPDLKTIKIHSLSGKFIQSVALPFLIHSTVIDKFNNIIYITEKCKSLGDPITEFIIKIHKFKVLPMIKQLIYLEKLINLKFSINLANQFLSNFPNDLKIYKFLQDLQIKINMNILIGSINTYYNFDQHHQKNSSMSYFKKSMNLSIDTLSKFNTDPFLLLPVFPEFIHPLLPIEPLEEPNDFNIYKSKFSDSSISYFLQNENSIRILLICINSLIPYLTDTRRRLIIQNDKNQDVSIMDSVSRNSKHLSDTAFCSSLVRLNQDQLRLIDNTLFICYLIVSPLLIAPLFRIKNYCDLEIVESRILKSKFKSMFVSGLLDFYYELNLHDRSIELLIGVIANSKNYLDDNQSSESINKIFKKVVKHNNSENESINTIRVSKEEVANESSGTSIDHRIGENNDNSDNEISFDRFLHIAKPDIYNFESVKQFNKKYINQYDHLIDYLCRINDLDLICDSVVFIINHRKTLASEDKIENIKESSFLKIFCCTSTYNESLDRIKVFDFIAKNYSAEYSIRYLDHIFKAYNDKTKVLHTKYIELLIRAKQYLKFEYYLNKDDELDVYYFEPRACLKLIENNLDDENYRELKYLQSLIYFKLHNFKKTIDILNDDLHDFAKCITFCEKIHDRSNENKDKTGIYQYLFDNLKTDDLKLKFFECIKADKFDPIKIFSSDSFPIRASIKSIKDSLLIDSINYVESQKNSIDLQAQLSKLKLLKLQQSLIKIKSEVIIIENSKCKYCGKSLIGTMLSCFKNGDVVHYGCVQDYLKSRKQIRYFLESKTLE